MNEEQKKRIAVVRFGVISDFVNRAQLERGEKQRLLEHKCAQAWQIPFSGRTRLTPSTILGWIVRYERSGGRLESLYPQDRRDQGLPRVIDPETAQALMRVRKEMPQRPVAGLIEEMVRRELVSPGIQLRPSTVYRFLREQGLMDLREPQPVDRRRFESELPNDLWQSDIMHGSPVLADGKKRKSYLIAFLDDYSQLIPHAEFYLSERLDSYLDALRKALRKRGLPRKLYVDNGSALRSRLLEEITASLGIALIHSRPYTPQGRGKIERLFRSVRSQFLSSCTHETLPKLNHALEEWIRNVYHSRPHGSTGQAPATGAYTAGSSIGVDGLCVIKPDGKLYIHQGIGNLGTESFSDTARVTAEMVNLPWEDCVVIWGNTANHLPWSSIQAGSQRTYAHTRANHATGMDLRKKLQEKRESEE